MTCSAKMALGAVVWYCWNAVETLMPFQYIILDL